MSQSWNDNTFEAGHVAQTDLQNMENNFACLKSSFSGAAAPANTVAGMLWFETDQKVLKTRNAADDDWYGLMHGDVSEKRLVYRDAAMDGYARDGTVTDRVLALKGGAIYVTGGAVAGTVGIPSHALTTAELPAHTHDIKTYQDSGGIQTYQIDSDYRTTAGATRDITAPALSAGAHTHTSIGSNTGHSHGGTGYRPSAAVCIIVYLDL
jgi:microcystin-dependent protein